MIKKKQLKEWRLNLEKKKCWVTKLKEKTKKMIKKKTFKRMSIIFDIKIKQNQNQNQMNKIEKKTI